MVDNPKVEVITCTEAGFWDDLIVSLPPDNNPYFPSAGMEDILLNSRLLESLPSPVKSSTKDPGQIAQLIFF